MIAGEGRPVAGLSRLREAGESCAVIDKLIAAQAEIQPTSREEMFASRDEERRRQ